MNGCFACGWETGTGHTTHHVNLWRITPLHVQDAVEKHFRVNDGGSRTAQKPKVLARRQWRTAQYRRHEHQKNLEIHSVSRYAYAFNLGFRTKVNRRANFSEAINEAVWFQITCLYCRGCLAHPIESEMCEMYAKKSLICSRNLWSLCERSRSCVDNGLMRSKRKFEILILPVEHGINIHGVQCANKVLIDLLSICLAPRHCNVPFNGRELISRKRNRIDKCWRLNLNGKKTNTKLLKLQRRARILRMLLWMKWHRHDDRCTTVL